MTRKRDPIPKLPSSPRPPTTLGESDPVPAPAPPPAPARVSSGTFDTPQSRYLLRAGVSTLLAFLASLGVAITDNSVTGSEWVTILIATVGALGAYLGVGAAVPAVEPFVGNRYAGADVPVPPAQPTKP